MLAVRRCVSEELGEALRRTLASSSRVGAGRRPRPAARDPAVAGGSVLQQAPQPSAAGSAAAEQQQQQQQQQDQLVAPKEEWTEVTHPGTGLPYYWNPQTGETTAIGEPRPGPEGRLAAYRRATVQPQSGVPASGGGGGGLGQMLAMGAGVGLVFALLTRVF